MEGGGPGVDVREPGGRAPVASPVFPFLSAPPPPAPPRLTGFSPQSAGSGTTVNIRGYNLSDATVVTFGGFPVLSFSAVSDTMIVAAVGTGATGRVKVAGAVGADYLTGFVYIQDTTQTAPSGGVFQLIQFSGAVAN